MTKTEAADVEARAREAIRNAIQWQFRMDEHEEFEAADRALKELAALQVRIVDAAQDDRRAEALAAADRLLNLIKDLDDNGLVVGEEPLCHYPCKYDAVSAQVLMESAVNKLASCLTDDERQETE